MKKIVVLFLLVVLSMGCAALAEKKLPLESKNGSYRNAVAEKSDMFKKQRWAVTWPGMRERSYYDDHEMDEIIDHITKIVINKQCKWSIAVAMSKDNIPQYHAVAVFFMFDEGDKNGLETIIELNEPGVALWRWYNYREVRVVNEKVIVTRENIPEDEAKSIKDKWQIKMVERLSR